MVSYGVPFEINEAPRFEIHTPPVEDLLYVFYRPRGLLFSSSLVILFNIPSGTRQKGNSNGLDFEQFHLKVPHPLCTTLIKYYKKRRKIIRKFHKDVSSGLVHLEILLLSGKLKLNLPQRSVHFLLPMLLEQSTEDFTESTLTRQISPFCRLPFFQQIAEISLFCFKSQCSFQSVTHFSLIIQGVKHQGVLRFELDRGVPLKPQNPYPSLRVILAEKGTHF